MSLLALMQFQGHAKYNVLPEHQPTSLYWWQKCTRHSAFRIKFISMVSQAIPPSIFMYFTNLPSVYGFTLTQSSPSINSKYVMVGEEFTNFWLFLKDITFSSNFSVIFFERRCIWKTCLQCSSTNFLNFNITHGRWKQLFHNPQSSSILWGGTGGRKCLAEAAFSNAFVFNIELHSCSITGPWLCFYVEVIKLT